MKKQLKKAILICGVFVTIGAYADSMGGHDNHNAHHHNGESPNPKAVKSAHDHDHTSPKAALAHLKKHNGSYYLAHLCDHKNNGNSAEAHTSHHSTS